MLFSFFTHSYVISFAKAYLLAVFVELLVFYPFVAKRIRFLKASVAVCFVNAVSLPVVWFLMPLMFDSYWAYACSAELFAVLSEAIMLSVLLPLSKRRLLVASVTMNMVSFLVGLMFPSLIAP